MEVIIEASAVAASALAARMICRALLSRKHPVLGLATGRTPLLLYDELVRLHEREGLSFKRATTFNLDEYIGLPEGHPSSQRQLMERALFSRVDIDSSRTFFPDVMAADLAAACAAYESAITRCGGIDLQLLGIGRNGHVGFNEPSSSLGSRTRVKTLTEQTRCDNAADFGNNPSAVPKHAVTVGIGTILEARTCVVMAFGEAKATAVAAAVEGPITAMVPASALQWHPDARIILDPAAGAQLRQREYYQWVYSNKPPWQAY